MSPPSYYHDHHTANATGSMLPSSHHQHHAGTSDRRWSCHNATDDFGDPSVVPLEHDVVHLRRLIHRMTTTTDGSNPPLPPEHVLERARVARLLHSRIVMRIEARRPERRLVREEDGGGDGYGEGDEDEEAERAEAALLEELGRGVEAACRAASRDAEEAAAAAAAADSGGRRGGVSVVEGRRDLIEEIFFGGGGENGNREAAPAPAPVGGDASIASAAGDAHDVGSESSPRDENGPESRPQQPDHRSPSGDPPPERRPTDDLDHHRQHRDGRSGGRKSHREEVEETRRMQAEALEAEIAEMAAQLKASTAAVNVTLKGQAKELDTMEELAEQNLDRVGKVTDTVTDRVTRGWTKSVAKWTMFLSVLATFLALFATTRVVPKRKNACLFWCEETAGRRRPPPQPRQNNNRRDRRHGGRHRRYYQQQRRPEEEEEEDDYYDTGDGGRCVHGTLTSDGDCRAPGAEFPPVSELPRRRGPKQVNRAGPSFEANLWEETDYMSETELEERARELAMERKQRRIEERRRTAESVVARDGGVEEEPVSGGRQRQGDVEAEETEEQDAHKVRGTESSESEGSGHRPNEERGRRENDRIRLEEQRRAEQARLAEEKLEEEKRLEEERAEKERIQSEKLRLEEEERIKQDRIAAELAEQERIRAEQVRLENEERKEKERAEQESVRRRELELAEERRKEQERMDAERLVRERISSDGRRKQKDRFAAEREEGHDSEDNRLSYEEDSLRNDRTRAAGEKIGLEKEASIVGDGDEEKIRVSPGVGEDSKCQGNERGTCNVVEKGDEELAASKEESSEKKSASEGGDRSQINDHIDLAVLEAELRQAAIVGDSATLRRHVAKSRLSIHKTDENGWQALHEASRAGHTEAVKILLDGGAAVNTRTNFGTGGTSLWWALMYHADDHPVVTLLKSRGARNIGPD